jgi:polyhydroxyalkanoate synthesis regulator phasin
VTSVREAVEQTILASVGAASLTRERAESIVNDLVRRGQLTGEEAKGVVDRLSTRVRGDSGAASGLAGRIEEVARRFLREVGLATHAEAEELELRLAEVEHRVRLLEGTAPAPTPDSEGLEQTPAA